MHLAFFIGMLLPLKWDYSTPVMYPLCHSADGYLHGMLKADTETFRMYADIISRGVYAKCDFSADYLQMFCNHSWLLACVYAFLSVFHTLCNAWALAGCTVITYMYIYYNNHIDYS